MAEIPVSVVIIAKNAQDTLDVCLTSVRANSPGEIVLVDGKSTDDTVMIAKRYTGTIFSDDGKGPAYARQLGAERAKQDHIAYVDSDVVLPEGALDTMLRELKASDCAVINAQICAERTDYGYWERAQWWQHWQTELKNGESHLATMACVMRRDLVLKYKFDSTGGTLDDIDLEYKLKAAGLKFANSRATVDHIWIKTFRGTMKRRFTIGRMKPHAMKKYGPWHMGYWSPLASVYWLARCIIKRRPVFVPFFVADGVAEFTGTLVGFVDVARGKHL